MPPALHGLIDAIAPVCIIALIAGVFGSMLLFFGAAIFGKISLS